MIRLTKEQVVLLHEKLIERYGGIKGIREEGLLDSALHAPFHSFGGIEAYPTLLGKAARLCYGLVKNHPFYDGNKRIGALVLLTTLDLNKLEITMTSEELEEEILSLAGGEISFEAFLNWVQEHTA